MSDKKKKSIEPSMKKSIKMLSILNATVTCHGYFIRDSDCVLCKRNLKCMLHISRAILIFNFFLPLKIMNFLNNSPLLVVQSYQVLRFFGKHLISNSDTCSKRSGQKSQHLAAKLILL